MYEEDRPSFHAHPGFRLGRAEGEIIACRYVEAVWYVGTGAMIELGDNRIGHIESPDGGHFTWSVLVKGSMKPIETGIVRCSEDPGIDGRNIWHAMARVPVAVPAEA